MSNRSFSVAVLKKIKSYKKSIEVDSDKSISIRSFLFSSISHNVSELRNVLESEDVFSTISCLKKLGVKIKKIKSKHYLVFGKGLGSLYAKKDITLDFGNSGTLARLLIGILSTSPNIQLKLKGDKSLNKRNMYKLINLMSEFGAQFYPKNKYNFPLRIISSEMPVAINYKAGISAQLKSAVILAGLNSYGSTKIIEKFKSRDHTENLLSKNLQVIKKNKKNIMVTGKKFKPIQLQLG